MRAALPPLALLGLIALSAAPALADEMWDTTWGRMIWETDRGETAVLSVAPAQGEPGMRLFVEGLAADVSAERGSYIGVWMADRRDGGCAIEVLDPVSGKSTAFWGTFRLTFVEGQFPSAWAGVWGECADAPTNALAGTPATGD